MKYKFLLALLLFTSTGIFCAEEDEQKVLRLRTKQCVICYESKNIKSFILLPCAHSYCKKCIQDIINAGAGRRHLPCPECRHPFNSNILSPRRQEMSETPEHQKYLKPNEFYSSCACACCIFCSILKLSN